MGELIEPGKNKQQARLVRVGDVTNQSEVSLQAYQALYKQVTGRNEEIRERYDDNILVEFSELEQLHYKMMQLCNVHNVLARNEVVTIFYDKDRKEQFTTFEGFRSYHANSARPCVNVVLKYNFSVIPPDTDTPQQYVVTARLSSRVAVINQLEEDAPPFARFRMYSFMASNTAEIKVEYADYVVARGFLEAFSEWIAGCKVTPENRLMRAIQKRSYLIPTVGRLLAAFVTAAFAYRAIPSVFAAEPTFELLAKSLVIVGCGFYLLVNLVSLACELIEESVASYTELSYLKLTKGDQKLIDGFCKRNQWIITKFIIAVLLNIVLNIIAAKLTVLV